MSKGLSFTFLLGGQVFSEATIVLASADDTLFAVAQSVIHETWARNYASSLETRLRYTPDDVFGTFPLPRHEGSVARMALDYLGETYHEHRRQILLARQEGLTATYIGFHNPDERTTDFARLRELHVEMDRAVAAAHGWDDLALDHGFHETAQGVQFTVSEAARREVLEQLLELNHQRHAEEVAAGLHENRGAKARSSETKKMTRPPREDKDG